MKSRLQQITEEAILLLEKRKPVMEMTDEAEKKIDKMVDLYLLSREAKQALRDTFTDWFEAVGKKLVHLKDDEYSLDDLDAIMEVVQKKIDQLLK